MSQSLLPPRPLSSALIGAAALVALTSPFLVSGLLKLADFAGAIDEVRALTGADASAAPWVAAVVVLVQLGGSALMLSGRRRAVTAGAAVLTGFTIVATLVAHDWWALAGAERARAVAAFFEHVAMCGGLALAAVPGWRR